MGKFKNLNYYDVKKFTSIKEMLELAVQDAGDKLAFQYKNSNQIINVTYKQFQEDTISLGSFLSNMNLDNKHIAIIGDNSYNWITVYLTVLKSNGVFVPIDKELPIDNIVNLLNHSDSEVLFFSNKFENNIQYILDNVPNLKYCIGFSSQNNNENILNFDDCMKKGKELFLSGYDNYLKLKSDPNSLKMLVYTSGTTGAPKGVMLSEHNLVSSVYYGLQVSTVYNKCLSVLPYHHTYEAVPGILVALHHHSTICINDSLKAVLKNLQLYKPDYIYLVPAFVEVFYKKILSNAKNSNKEFLLKTSIIISNFLRKFKIDLRKSLFKSIHEAFGGNLKKIVVGGAPVRKELGTFFDSIGINLINGYGITECSPLVSANMDDFNDCSTVGIQLPCVDLKFENIAPDGNGEICIKGDIVMMGYYKNPELTSEVLKDGWFYTGDYGRLNKNNQLLITGRKKNIIVLNNGKNVFPEEIEEYILGIPYIQEAIVKSIKDDDGLEIALCAEVFLNKDKLLELNITPTENTIKQDILNICKDLPVYKKISKVSIRDTEFTKTTTNKIKR